jgi:serine/threonine protein kinase
MIIYSYDYIMLQTRKNFSTRKRNISKKNTIIKKLNKCPNSRITGMESYKVNCSKNLLLGYRTIKASEETSSHKDDFVHVVISRLKDYNKPVIVKVYDENNYYLNTEIKILQKINGFRNTAQLICEFTCNDSKNKYITKITNHLRFCGDGLNKIHVFVFEYIPYGDISDFLLKNPNIDIIKSLILQITCTIIQLASIYHICHGDINSGNILIDITNETTIDYCIDEEIVTIQTYGIIPKMIDYGRSYFYKQNISRENVWHDIILALGVMHSYTKNDIIKPILLDISNTELDGSLSLKEYYLFIKNKL